MTKVTSSGEYAQIRPLVQAHVKYERSAATVPADWAERITELVAVGRLTIFCARAGRETVGYASVTTDVATWTGEDFTHLDCVFVTESHRGAGLGRLLVKAAAEHARSRGHGELQWQTSDWNTSAIRFYERLRATHQPKERFTLALR